MAALTAAAVLSVMAVPAGAQSRAQPIRFVVPYPPGGAADQITRLVAQHASVTLGTPIVVDNKGGAGGIIAAEAVARAEPDGKTAGQAACHRRATDAGLGGGVRAVRARRACTMDSAGDDAGDEGGLTQLG
ncbi:hypothetical protein AWV79_16210 [Cupriavidus sp. UYMMa02A]|nr:hypothetical protein AWV79_16210 [Cupriavidus sp. UYMMa02A]